MFIFIDINFCFLEVVDCVGSFLISLLGRDDNVEDEDSMCVGLVIVNEMFVVIFFVNVVVVFFVYFVIVIVIVVFYKKYVLNCNNDFDNVM